MYEYTIVAELGFMTVGPFVKKTVSREFRFFPRIIFPQAPEQWDPFEFFTKIRGDICKSRCATGINDTGGKFAIGVNDTDSKFVS
jgi:hypothetical protein